MTIVPGSAPSRIVGVRRLAEYLKRRLENDPQLRDVAVRGEITNVSVPRSGHSNFDLKEGDVVLRCFAWAGDAAGFPPLRNGLAVVATGSITTYAPKSTYQLLVRAVALEGMGNVHTLFEARKRKLAAEGLFEPARKRPLPAYPFAVALVSSRLANGAIDFVTILRERAPHVRVVWCETSVQGPNAANEICRALWQASRENVDAIVVTRGGGSFEDLFAFSDEQVVRAVAAAKHPTISAIGHTVDQQLCDFAADRHVETPSAAAELASPQTRGLLALVADQARRARDGAALRVERLGARLDATLVRSKLADVRLFFTPLVQRLSEAEGGLDAVAAHALRGRERRVRDLARRLEAFDPSRQLAERGRRLSELGVRLESLVRARCAAAGSEAARRVARLEPAVRRTQERNVRRCELAYAHLRGNDPEAILQRGYAIVRYAARIVRDPASVPAGARIEARIARGTLYARVESATDASEGTNGNERIG